MKIVYNNVDYREKFGGMIIREYKDKWCITTESNVQGNWSNVKYTVPKSVEPSLENLVDRLNRAYWIFDEYKVRKGYIVQ